MGVTAHFFAFDPARYPTLPTIDRLVEAGDLDRELRVVGGASEWLAEVDTPLGDNKRWYDNLAGDFAWDRAREHVEPALRAELDRWFSHLFWDREGEGCPCGRHPVVVGETEVVHDHDLLTHVLSLARPLSSIEPALAIEFAGDPPRSERLDRPWIYDFDGFCELVHERQRVLQQAARRPGWSLLQWIWY